MPLAARPRQCAERPIADTAGLIGPVCRGVTNVGHFPPEDNEPVIGARSRHHFFVRNRSYRLRPHGNLAHCKVVHTGRTGRRRTAHAEGTDRGRALYEFATSIRPRTTTTSRLCIESRKGRRTEMQIFTRPRAASQTRSRLSTELSAMWPRVKHGPPRRHAALTRSCSSARSFSPPSRRQSCCG